LLHFFRQANCTKLQQSEWIVAEPVEKDLNMNMNQCCYVQDQSPPYEEIVVVADLDRWKSFPGLRTSGRWASDSWSSLHDESQIRPPRRPIHHEDTPNSHAAQLSNEDFRWSDKSCTQSSSSSRLAKPIRRKSLNIQDIDFTKANINACYHHSHGNLRSQRPKITAAYSA
jgi:hypothetical protein